MLCFQYWEQYQGIIFIYRFFVVVVLVLTLSFVDGAIVLFSGLGPDAQDQLSVGVGALAGSTIMVLTLPWMLTIFSGYFPSTFHK